MSALPVGGPPATPGAAVALDELTTSVLAPNPSPMTLEGTNTYVLSVAGGGAAVVVDPGPALPQHRAAIDAALAARDAEVAAVVISHHHHDHAEAAGWATDWGAPLLAFDPVRIGSSATALSDGGVVAAGGVRLTAVHTPGHSADHLCLRVDATGVVLTGDHVLGRGSSIVAWPDGDMAAYLASLERLAALDASRLYPGHGPPLDEPAAAVAAYVAHRHDREREVLAAIADGAQDPGAIVRKVYVDVPALLHPAAELSVRALLAMLEEQGRAPAGIATGAGVAGEPWTGEPSLRGLNAQHSLLGLAPPTNA